MRELMHAPQWIRCVYESIQSQHTISRRLASAREEIKAIFPHMIAVARSALEGECKMSKRDAAGKYNSSITRVWPVFLQLLDRDPTGGSWLKDLLAHIGKMNELASAMSRLDCTIVQGLRTERNFARYEPPVCLPLCLEYDAPAPERFLAWLIRHPESIDWSKLSSEAPPSQTFANRNKLRANDPEVIESGLNNLVLSGSRDAKGRGTWWAFEGPTSVDCFLETEDFVLAVEGKRTEQLSARTEWVKSRNQLARNLEIAENLARGRRYGALLIVEGKDDFKPIDHSFLADDLPHYSDAEREFLARHFIGSATWADVCGATGLDFAGLPKTSADFCISFASRVVEK